MYLPIPMSLLGVALRLAPERAFEDMRMKTPQPYSNLVTKENITILVGECMDIMRENRGLEVIHVEAEDGTFVSIRL